jgi:flagellin
MPIVVNTNNAATAASFNLSKNAEALRKSLARLSSGKRITQPAEDAGGMAVAYKLDSQARRTEAVLNNHQNALSYLQVQDGALETVGKVVNRMSELRTMAADVTKNSSDIENYSKEFRELQSQLKQMSLEKFNGISIFSVNGSSGMDVTKKFGNDTYDGLERTLLTHPSGVETNGAIKLNVTNLTAVLSLGNISFTSTSGVTSASTNSFNLMGVSVGNGNVQATSPSEPSLIDSNGFIDSISSISISQFTDLIQKVADARAENGAEQQRIQQSYELHQTNLVNIEAAHGRIMDVDVALESTRFAKNNVLVQASASMTAQANQLTQVALTLLQ